MADIITDMDFAQFLNQFVALLVISNPLAALPAVLRITRHQTPEEKRRTGVIAAVAVGIILLTSTWVGTPLLKIMGIQIPAFQIAGGFILLLMSLSMLSAEESPMKAPVEDPGQKKKDTGSIIVPLAIPIIAGPGAMSTVIVAVNEFPGFWNQILISMTAILVALTMGVLLVFASTLEKLFGQSGINVVNRIGGLILAAISVQAIAVGIMNIFPGLSGRY